MSYEFQEQEHQLTRRPDAGEQVQEKEPRLPVNEAPEAGQEQMGLSASRRLRFKHKEGASTAGALIVDDRSEAGTDAMTKSAFLSAVDASVRGASDAILAKAGRTSADCPWISFSLNFYRHHSAGALLRAICRYVPEAAGATNASEMIAMITTRATGAVANWVATGAVKDLPPDVAMRLPQHLLPGGEESEAGKAQQQLQGGGESLESGVKSKMESAMGADLSGVKVHTGAVADQLTNQHDAKALTVGQDIAFGSGQYEPGTMHGDALIAHELAHTVQQKEGLQKKGTHTNGSESAYEQDADETAVGAVSSIWGQTKEWASGLGKKTGAALKSGLQLQKCGGEKPADASKVLSYDITKAELSDPSIEAQVGLLNETQLYDYWENSIDPEVKAYMLDRLIAIYPDKPLIADLVHIELITVDPALNPQKIFVNLQKLNKDDAQIKRLNTIYTKKYTTSLEADLRAKLSGRELQLALELLNIKAVVDQTDLINQTLPVAEDDYKIVAAKINGALIAKAKQKETVFAALIPFNRDATKLAELQRVYGVVYTGHTLEGDIRNNLIDDQAQAYALYLLFAPAAATPLDDSGLINSGAQVASENITGGKVALNTGVDFGTNVNGYSVGYSGGLSPDSHWLQFIWREVIYYTDDGAGGLKENKRNDLVGSSSGKQYHLTTDPAHPEYNTDSKSTSNPFYEAEFADKRTAESTTMYDAPSSSQPFVDMLFDTQGAKKVVLGAHFNTFLIRDFSAIEQVTVDVQWTYNAKTDPETKMYSNTTAQQVKGLPEDMKKVLNDQYNKKFSYIQ